MRKYIKIKLISFNPHIPELSDDIFFIFIRSPNSKILRILYKILITCQYQDFSLMVIVTRLLINEMAISLSFLYLASHSILIPHSKKSQQCHTYCLRNESAFVPS